MKKLLLLIPLMIMGCEEIEFEFIEVNNIGISDVVVQTGGELLTVSSGSSINLPTYNYNFIIVKCVSECKYSVGNKNYYRTNRFK